MLKRLAASLPTLLLLTASVQAVEPASNERLDEVTRRGAQVMPFSLEQTTHRFSKTAHGGIQQVIAKNASDAEQIRLIREHLSKIAQQFRQGDFSGPIRIHGEAMPGLAALRAAQPGRIKIVYKTLPKGAGIDYTTDDPKLVEAIHLWFDAQLSDHARHAIPGHPHHLIHPQP